MASNPFDQFDAMPDGDVTPRPRSQPALAPVPTPAPANDPSATSASTTTTVSGSNPFDQFDAAPITDSGMTQGWREDAPVEATRQLSPEDTATFYRMLRGDGVPKATADQLRQFVASKGMVLSNADDIVAARDKAGTIVGQINYPLPKPAGGTTRLEAAVRGAGQGPTLGFSDELHGLGAGAIAAAQGGSFTDAYDSTVDTDRGLLAADQEQHPYASLAGNLAGGMLLPVVGEESGLVRGTGEVAQAAYRTARLEGFTTDEARVIAQREVTWRLAKEGAAYGGAYGVGTSDGGPGERIIGGLTGAAEGAIGGGIVGKIGEALAPGSYATRVAARGLPIEQPTEAQRVAQAAADQSVDILPQDVGGPGVARATQAAAQTPYGASAVRRAADNLYNTFSGRVADLAADAPNPADTGNIVGARAQQAADRAGSAAERTSGTIVNALGDPADSTGAGQLVQRGVSRFMDDTADKATELYQAVPIAADQPAQLGATRRVLNDLTAEWASNPKLGALFQNGRLSGYLDALTPNVTKAATGLLDASGKPITRDVTEGGALNWQDLSEFRTRVGDMLANPRLDEKIAPRQLSALYGALTSDMKATAEAAGPDALAKWQRANNFYDGRMKRVNNTFSLVLGQRKDATPNEAYAALQAMLKSGSTGNTAAFARIMRSLPEQDANTVRASIVSDARGGRAFEPDKLAKAWGQISERGKSALLPQPGMRVLMDDAAGRAAIFSRNPFAGKSGEQIYSALEAMANNRGDAMRFHATMAGLSPDEANAVRSTFIDQAGRAPPGQQNADGSAFSISRWLTRYNQMGDAQKNVLFGTTGDLRKNMDDLALIADRVKASERLAGHSNTGGIREGIKTNTSLAVAVGALLTGHPIVAASLAAPAVTQRLSAEVLTSPRLLNWLARATKKPNAGADRAHLQALTRIAASEPAIAGSILDLRHRLEAMISTPPLPLAAKSDDNQDRQ